MAVRAIMETTGEQVLRQWGAHWKARLEGCPREILGNWREPEKEPGDVLKEMEILKARFPHMTYEEAKDAIKYAPLPRRDPSPPNPGMAQIERDVSLAVLSVGEAIWTRFRLEELGIADPEDIPASEWRGRQTAILAVRFLIRQVYVNGTPVRSPKYPKSAFDWLYPFAARSKDRTDDGKLTTLRQVRDLL